MSTLHRGLKGRQAGNWSHTGVEALSENWVTFTWELCLQKHKLISADARNATEFSETHFFFLRNLPSERKSVHKRYID